ncbi:MULTISPECIES: hypothetical protein [Salinicola]|uniref:hypothetical protein n=1 Tax=Salinicola TaxID=404432 RepID=UPI0013A67161|nr:MULTISPECIES: hypothetical protein [Salinicola]
MAEDTPKCLAPQARPTDTPVTSERSTAQGVLLTSVVVKTSSATAMTLLIAEKNKAIESSMAVVDLLIKNAACGLLGHFCGFLLFGG